MIKQNKWYLDEKCRHGKDCHGWKSGACPYNHQGLCGYIQTKGKIPMGKIPKGFCKYENPWEGKRCMRLRCFCDHLRGRVQFVERKQHRYKIGPKNAGAADTGAVAIEAPRTPDRPTRPVSPRAPARPARHARHARHARDIVSAAVGLPIRVSPPPLSED
jgi:hypothetical protein